MLRQVVRTGLDKQDRNFYIGHQYKGGKTRALRNRHDSTRSCEDLETEDVPRSIAGGDCFMFPPPPQMTPKHRSMSASSYGHSQSDSDSQSESGRGCNRSTSIFYRGYQNGGSPVALHSLPRFLPPIGVFWDIENCQVPKGRSAVSVAQVIRDKFFTGYREAEFVVVCDVKKENAQVVQELNDAQVNLIHVAATCKNAADEKLRQSIRRFADIHGSPAAIILISGDINFAADLSDLRHRKKIHVILLHNNNTSEALILCASENYRFSSLVESLPLRIKQSSQAMDVVISNLPDDMEQTRIRNRLRRLSDNCGGRVVCVNKREATIRFSTLEYANRAQKRMDGEDVFGRKITVGYPTKAPEASAKESSPVKIPSARKCITRFNSRGVEENGLHYGVYGSVPNVLSSIPNPNVNAQASFNGWNASVDLRGYGMLSHNQENLFGGSADFLVSSLAQFEQSLNFDHMTSLTGLTHSPNVFPQSPEGQQNCNALPCAQSPMAQLGPRPNAATNGNPAKSAEGLRKIRGAYAPSNGVDMGAERKQHSAGAMFASRHGVRSQQKVSHPSLLKRYHTPSPRTTTQQHMYIPAGAEDSYWPKQVGAGMGDTRLCRTPSPYTVTKANIPKDLWPAQLRPCGSKTNTENFFHPIQPKSNNSSVGPNCNPIELQVTNFDQTLDAKEIKKVLATLFKEHVKVLHISVFMQSDNNLAAHVKVPSLQEAQYAISQLHRRKLGYKRILISYAHSGGPSPQLVRSQIVSLLLEVPGHSLPLFKFRELFESRYLTSISVSDMYKMKDVCLITEDSCGRMVSLNPDHRNTPSPCLTSSQDGQVMELPYCTLHPMKPGVNKGWAEQEMAALPNVRIELKLLDTQIRELLRTHKGSLPLPSLPNCYEAQFGMLEMDEAGVPLEHLVSCLSGVEIYQGVGCVKYLRWLESSSGADSQTNDLGRSVSPSLAWQLALFSRELVDLLKTSHHCQLQFGRFIPAYHHHFGRQCRVADYGFTKLIDLLDAMPQIVQVMGDGNKRVVTLSHRAQLRRFTSDLLRILKFHAAKQVALSEFPDAFQRVMSRAFDIVEYGVCDIGDMLSQVSENAVVLTRTDSDTLISIPKREQTVEEMEKTTQFAEEVEDVGEGERKVSLTLKEGLRVLTDQVIALMRSSRSTSLSLPQVSKAFLRLNGYSLRPETFECASLEQLIELIPHAVNIVLTDNGPVISLVDQSKAYQLGLRARRVMLEKQQMTGEEFVRAFWLHFQEVFDLDTAEKEMSDILQVTRMGSATVVRLTPLQQFARNVYRLLYECGGSLPLASVEFLFQRMYGVTCQPAQYGFPSLEALLQAIPETVHVRSKDVKKVLLNLDLMGVGIPFPPNYFKNSHISEEDNVFNGHYESNCDGIDHLMDYGSNHSSEELKTIPERPCELPSQSSGKDDRPTKPEAEIKSPYKTPQVDIPPCSQVTRTSPSDLYSPAHNLLPAYSHPLATPHGGLPHVVAPDPSELPLPLNFAQSLNIGKNLAPEEKWDLETPKKGHMLNGDLNTGLGVESGQSTPNKLGRKRRLAAQFNTPMQMT